MLKNSDFKDLLKGYEPTPPDSVWENIIYQLGQEKSKPVGFWQFNSAQKFTLVAASFVSIFLSAFVFKFNQVHTIIADSSISTSNHSVSKLKTEAPALIAKSHPKINFTKSESINQNSNQSIVNKNSYSNQSVSNSNNQTQVSTKLILSEELKPFKKEILELADLDKAINQLVRSIEKENLRSSYEPEIIYASQENQQKELVLNLSHFKSNQTANNQESSLVENPKSNLSFLSKIYVTPTFGANITKISYSNASNSPYFTQNAEFGAKIGYNAGFQLGYQFNPRWSIESGISFGQYLQSFKELLNNKTVEREGIMYIDQLDFPLLARYSIPFGSKNSPKTISFKGGLIYNSVIQYQVNYLEKDLIVLNSPVFQKSIDADKRNYNSLQLGYAAGFDFDSYLTNKISINFSLLNSYVSQLENFPTFNQDTKRPRQFSTSFSIGTKIRL